MGRHMFNVGDRVIFTAERDDDGGVICGQRGIVVDIDTYDSERIGICWDEEDYQYHSCSGNCDEHHGWYVDEDYLTIEPPDDLDSFESDGNAITDLFES